MAKAEISPITFLRVSRPVSACQRCRGAKIKCDGKLPACTACERAGKGHECSNANDKSAKGKERSYVASLETRIDRLERQATQAKGRKASIDMLGIASAAGFFPPNQLSSNGTWKLDKQEASSVDDLVSDFGFLSVNATARDFHGFAGEMSFARLVISTSSLEALPDTSTFTLPQRYEITPLLQHYLENVHVVYPVISETRLFASIDAVYGHSGLYASSADRWLTLMVLAVSCASLAQMKGDSSYLEGLGYAAAALNYVESIIQPGSILGIQAILLMVLLAMWLPHHYNSWYLIGVASRAAVDLGLHQNPTAELQLKTLEIETRQRTFDCVYSLDRSISMVNQRAFSFTDDSIDITTNVDEQQRLRRSQSPFSLNLQPAVELVKLRRIQSCSYQKIFQSERLPLNANWPIMCKAVHDMEQWFSSLQARVNQALLHHAHCEVLFSNILMLTPSNWIEELPSHAKFLIFQYAHEYADNILSSINTVSEVFGFYTSHDLLRASFVAQRFISLMQIDHRLLISSQLSTTPKTAAYPGVTMAWTSPDTLSRSDKDSLERLIRVFDCLKHFETAIEYFGLKYGYTDPLSEYQTECSSLKHKLTSWATSLTKEQGVP